MTRRVGLVVGAVLPCAASGLPCAFAAPGATGPGLSAEVRVERQDRALGCPDDETLAVRIERILQRSLSGHVSRDRSIRVHVRFRRIADAFVADVEFHGSKEGVRVLSDRSPQCEPLADAVSVAIALVLDRELMQADRAAAAESRGAPKPAPGSPVTEPTQSTVEHHGLSTHNAGLGLRVAAGVGVATGFADSVSPLWTAELGVPVSHWAFVTSLGSVLASRTNYGDGLVETSLLMGSLGACRVFGERVWGGPCAFVGMGRLRGRGVGYDEDRTKNMLWSAAGAGIVGEGLVWGPLSVGMMATLWVPARRQSFSVENAGPAWHSPRVSGWITCRVGLWFR